MKPNGIVSCMYMKYTFLSGLFFNGCKSYVLFQMLTLVGLLLGNKLFNYIIHDYKRAHTLHLKNVLHSNKFSFI